jgi:hypothetical protein
VGELASEAPNITERRFYNVPEAGDEVGRNYGSAA